MACYSPLLAYARFRDDGSGKKDIVFVDSHIYDYYDKDGVIYREKLEIPCGRCIGCRLEYSRQWAIRCVLEAKQHSNNYFLTLTYDDDHLPVSDCSLVDTNGEVISSFSSNPLVPSHLTLFMKNLRRQLEYHYNWEGVRFFACGEYGDLRSRPHYHIILFNMPVLDDLVIYKTNFNGSILYNSSFIDKIWKNGYSVLAEVNFDTCAYVSRYVMKKHKGKDKSYYDERGLVPEFSRCSRRPGIANSYYESEKGTIYDFDEISLLGRQGKTMRVKPPKYYDRLYDADSHDIFLAIKEKRQETALNRERSVLERTSLSREEYRDLQHKNKIESLKKLIRPLDE